MSLFKFTKLPKYREFNYVPRYYDPKKDERDAIIRRAKAEAGLINSAEDDQSIENAKIRINNAFRTRGISTNYSRKSHKQSNIRVIVIVLILAGLAYAILNFNVEGLIKMVE
ncbi:hypothetical protein [Membranihabitans marinus]|uniref:hypothetical protein n=1 Tax=Membranihabitans marinus TaxID=1227546 RepID=UPI001F294981|nr:hypothetical protein [Membranihabitans marinus]